jgi:hypothetical protein
MSSFPVAVVPEYLNIDDGGGGGGSVNSVNAGVGITVTGTATDPIINAIPDVKPINSIFVSPNGNDITNTGGPTSPFLTIAKALVFRSTIATETQVEIILYAGTYNENVDILVTNTIITAFPNAYDSGASDASNANSKQVIINGAINVLSSFLSSTQSSVSICNLNINGAINTGSIVNQNITFRMTNCRIDAMITNTQSTDNIYTAIYSDCYFTYISDAAMFFAEGVDVQIIRCEFLHFYTVFGPIITINSGVTRGGTMNMQYSRVLSTTQATNPAPLIRYINSIASSGDIYLHNTFAYLLNTTDSSNDKCCIQFQQNVSITIDMIAYNVFKCDGATYTGGQPYAIQNRNTAGSVAINSFGGNYGGQFAHRIDSSITIVSKFVAM